MDSRAETDADLVEALARATRRALVEVREENSGEICTVALVTSGEMLRPYLCVTRHGPERWNLAEEPNAVVADHHFASAANVWDARGGLFDRGDEEIDAEFALRQASMEQALRCLDVEAEFGRGPARDRILLLVEVMPPDPDVAGAARRLNPDGSLLACWLAEASEAPTLEVDSIASDERTTHVGPLAAAPNPTIAGLWRMTPGLYLNDGTAIYGPHSIAERNETYEYVPGWVLIGDDGGGRAGVPDARITRVRSAVWATRGGGVPPGSRRARRECRGRRGVRHR